MSVASAPRQRRLWPAFEPLREQTFRRIAYLTIFLSAIAGLPLWDALLGR